MVKNLPVNAGDRIWSLGQEGPLEKEMATYSSILAWRISWAEEPGRLQSMGSQRVGHNWATEYKHTTTYHLLLAFCKNINSYFTLISHFPSTAFWSYLLGADPICPQTLCNMSRKTQGPSRYLSEPVIVLQTTKKRETLKECTIS